MLCMTYIILLYHYYYIIIIISCTYVFMTWIAIELIYVFTALFLIVPTWINDKLMNP